MAMKTKLEREQSIIDKHDDDITTLSVRLQTLLAPSKIPVAPAADGRKLLSRKLAHLESSLSRIDDMVSTPPDSHIEPCSSNAKNNSLIIERAFSSGMMIF